MGGEVGAGGNRAAVHPSGTQVVLSRGPAQASVVEVGAGLRTLTVGGHDVLDGYGVQEMAPSARGQVLVPWPNRLHQGRYSWDGVQHTVPLDEPEQANAIHGLVRWRTWTASDRTEDTVTMGLALLPCPAYPFALELQVRYTLTDDGVTVTTSATNVGAVDAPYGAGHHPYVTAGTRRVDEADLTLPARTYLPTGPAQIPIGPQPVDGTPYDFRRPRPIGPLHVDLAFTDLERDADGRATVSLRGPQRTVQVWVDESWPYLQVFTADPLPPARRRRSLGVEPMTCPPNALQTGQDVVRLRPGQTWTGTWGIRVR